MNTLDIIVATRNAKEKLLRAISSIYSFRPRIPFRVLIIDNASSDGTEELVRREFSSYKNMFFLKNNKNMGVAPARNQGLRWASADYILLIDDDTELINDAINIMISFMERNRVVGVVGPRMYNEKGEFLPSYKRFPHFLAPFMHRMSFIPFIKKSNILRKHLLSDIEIRKPTPVDYVIGACQLIRREVLEKTGPLDGHIFYGTEDIDFCIRVWMKGYAVVYHPGAEIIHYWRRSSYKKIFKKNTFLHFKNYIYLMCKYANIKSTVIPAIHRRQKNFPFT